uniref:RING-type domain-containing protein n=1 Tax=Globodera rostochiensis TaxID=31243 RepID=A0A914IC09_GLORO
MNFLPFYLSFIIFSNKIGLGYSGNFFNIGGVSGSHTLQDPIHNQEAEQNSNTVDELIEDLHQLRINDASSAQSSHALDHQQQTILDSNTADHSTSSNIGNPEMPQNPASDSSSSSLATTSSNHNNNCTLAECPICLEAFSAEADVKQLRSCRHRFHRECVDRWLVQILNTTCPVCRDQVDRDDLPPAAGHRRLLLLNVAPDIRVGFYLINNEGNDVGTGDHVLLTSTNVLENLQSWDGDTIAHRTLHDQRRQHQIVDGGLLKIRLMDVID